MYKPAVGTLAPARWETALVFMALAIYPTLILSVRHVVGTAFVLLLLATLAVLYRSRRSGLRRMDAEAWLFTLVMALPTLAVLVSQIGQLAFDPRPYDETMRFLLAVPIFLGLRRLDLDPMTILRFAFPLGAAGTLLWILLATDYWQLERIETYFLNAIHFGNLALALGLVSLLSIRIGRLGHPALVSLQVLGFIAGLYLSVRSGSRGGWIALPPVLLIWLYYQRESWTWRATLTALVAIVLLGVAFYLGVDTVRLRAGNFFTDLAALASANMDTSTGMRLQIWQGAWQLFLESPWIGLGGEGYRSSIVALSENGSISPLAASFGVQEVHHQVLSYTVKYGVLGLLAMLAVYLVPLFVFVRTGRSEAGLIGLGFVTAFLIYGLTVEIFNLKMTVTFYTITVAILMAVVASPIRIKQSVSA